MKTDWLKKYFESGFYEKYWGWKIEKDNSESLAESALKLLNAKSGHILDWCGGWGRVSIYFARKGYKVTILDFIDDYLKKAKEKFNKEGLEVNTVLADCRNTPPEIQADYATCFFNSIGFFDDNEQIKAFKSLYNALKPDGKIMIDCMNLFFLTNWIKPINETIREDGYTFRQKNDFNYLTNTMHSYFEVENEKGKIEAREEFYQRLFTPMDLKNLIELAGFKVINIYGNYNGEVISFASSKIIVIAAKK